ncbi:hypothetical protein BREVUG8_90193 [Brevundimonas sp. G8]|nr:hypothetical protein BREVUG8_90193 [Brevundimonas sp. G8]
MSQDGEDQFADTSAYWTQAMHVNDHVHLDQLAHGRLNIQRIPSEAVYRIDV